MGDGGLCGVVAGKPPPEDLDQRLTLDALGEVGHAGMVVAAHGAPEARILCFGVQNDPVEVEKCHFEGLLHAFYRILGANILINS